MGVRAAGAGRVRRGVRRAMRPLLGAPSGVGVGSTLTLTNPNPNSNANPNRDPYPNPNQVQAEEGEERAALQRETTPCRRGLWTLSRVASVSRWRRRG